LPYPRFKACGLHELYEISANTLDDKILSIQGVLVGLVDQTTKSVMESSTDSDLNTVLRKAHELAMSKSGINEEDFLRTIFKDRSIFMDANVGFKSKTEKMLDRDLIAARTWWHWLRSREDADWSDVTPKPSAVIEGHTRLQGLHEGSRFFTCESGTIGIARSTIRNNDRIYVVKGSPGPFVLRPCDLTSERTSRNSPGDKYYTFVTCCYVHRFMNGEAVVGDVKWETLLLC
jgi:hypothetical protein